MLCTLMTRALLDSFGGEHAALRLVRQRTIVRAALPSMAANCVAYNAILHAPLRDAIVSIMLDIYRHVRVRYRSDPGASPSLALYWLRCCFVTTLLCQTTKRLYWKSIGFCF